MSIGAHLNACRMAQLLSQHLLHFVQPTTGFHVCPVHWILVLRFNDAPQTGYRPGRPQDSQISDAVLFGNLLSDFALIDLVTYCLSEHNNRHEINEEANSGLLRIFMTQKCGDYCVVSVGHRNAGIIVLQKWNTTTLWDCS